MKKLLLILLCLPMIFSSCEEEKESINIFDPITLKDRIIGSWKIDSFVLESDTSAHMVLSSDPFIGIFGGPTAIEFISGGILHQTIEGSIHTNEWFIIGDSLHTTTMDSLVKVSYMQEVSDSNLVLVETIKTGGFADWHTLIINGTRD